MTARLAPPDETYEKVRPLSSEARAHREDSPTNDEREREEKVSPHRQIIFVEHSSTSALDEADGSARGTSISPLSFSSDEFPLASSKYSNEGLKTDDESGMTKSYVRPFVRPVNEFFALSDRMDDDQCEYEIDLGNGSITKSNSSNKQQQRTTSIISADSARLTTMHHLPFTNAYYEEPQHRPKEYVVYRNQPTHIIFNSAEPIVKDSWSIKSLNNVTIASISIFVSLVIILFVTFLAI